MQKNVKCDNSYNAMIDILRFIFSLIIVLHHSYMLTVPNTVPCIFHGGWIFTDFFFLLSGSLMVKSIQGKGRGKNHWLIADIRFLAHKVGEIYPYFLVAFLVEFLVKEILSKIPLIQMLHDLVKSIWTLSLLYMVGLPDCGIMGIVWYISSMLLCMAVLYPFLYNKNDLYLRVISPVFALVSYVWMDIYTGGNGLGVGSVREWVGICYLGTVRAFGGISQ